jgi:hypothetical protein
MAGGGIFMVDASKGFIKDGNKNRLRAQDIHNIVDTFTKQAEVPKYARMVPLAEVQANDFNLNLGGMGQINAIVNDTNFVEAESVGGTATATSSINAVALNVAQISVGADLMLTGSTTANSQTNAQSV